jgi:hypothetical protein
MALGLNYPPRQYTPGLFPPGVKQPGREADRSLLFGAQIKHAEVYTCTPPICNVARNFFLICIGGWSPNWVHSARRPFIGLLYLPRVIVRMMNLVEWMTGETEVLGENLPRRHFVHHKSHLTRPGIEPGLPRWEASD